MSVRISKPGGALRFALRLPVHLYHAGLGWLLDHRFMLLTHQGRKSGRTYETVLPHVHLSRARAGIADDVMQNLIMVAGRDKGSTERVAAALDGPKLGSPVNDRSLVLTDDYAPVEQLLQQQ